MPRLAVTGISKRTRRILARILFLLLPIWGADSLLANTMLAAPPPRNAAFVDQASTIWDGHKELILGSLIVFLVQTLTITGLMYNRRRRIEAEKLLLEIVDCYRANLEVALEHARQYEEGLELLLKLDRQASGMTEKQICEHALDIAVKTTKSSIGYLHNIIDGKNTISLGAWDTEALNHCTAACESHYPIGAAGICDCARMRAPVICNDYHNIGGSAGHAQPIRYMSVPVVDGNRVHVIIGVGNKAGDYVDEDARQLMLVANEVQKIVMRRRAEQTLNESEARFRFISDFSPEMVWVADTSKLCTWFNKTWLDFTGRSMEQELGNGWAESVHPDDFGAYLATYVSHFDARKAFAREYRLRRHDGEYRWVLDIGQPRTDENGAFKGYVGSCLDITERFNAEQEQKTLETQLRQAQKMELVGQLTGGIAHDFNNILASMLGYAELIQMSSGTDRQSSLYLQEILQAGIRAKELVAQLLTFSHRREAATEAIFVAPIVKEVAKLLRATMPASISIGTHIAKGLPEVLISPVQLHQILMNLGINARDVMADNGTIEIKAEQVVLDGFKTCSSCGLNISGRHLMISVRDTGSGIPPENLSKIFDPFFTTKKMGQGSGLGLSVLHGIVHSANGHIEVLTAPGEGTEFRVYLPAQSREAGRPAREVKPGSKNASVCGHIMVVDDEASIVGFTTALLENLGCKVTGLTSATEALRLFQDNPHGVDMVITDQSMPDLTGAELARAMLKCRPDIPIVMSTGYSNAINEEMARQIGIRRFFIKPVPAKFFADVIAECLAVKADKPAGIATGKV